MEKTNVIFRKFKGEIVAIFPNEKEINNLVLSYQHVGQHSSCSYGYVIDASKPATIDEYAPLKSELESIGYNLNIIKRKPKNK